MKHLRLFALLALAFVASTQAATVYRTVAADGVVTFSDTPPPDTARVETLHIAVPMSSAADSLLNLEAMRQTTDRMAADRREREAQREQAAAKAQSERVLPPTLVRHEYVYVPVPVAPWRPGFRPHSHPHHSGARPPLQHQGIVPGPNSQLMRPLLTRLRD